jgi:hypothetical protein
VIQTESRPNLAQKFEREVVNATLLESSGPNEPKIQFEEVIGKMEADLSEEFQRYSLMKVELLTKIKDLEQQC